MACSDADSFGPSIVGDGNRLWASNVLDASANASAPMVGVDGDVIAADDKRLVHFGARG